MILVNFKIYKESFGDKAVELAKICAKVAKKTGVKIIPVVSALDAYRIKKEVGGDVYLQSVDAVIEGAKTGFISPVAAKELKIDGSIINHSEHRLKTGTIKQILKDWPKDFKSVLCVSSLGQIDKWAKNTTADIVAYEPKELIGSKDKSVATEKSETIKKIAEIYKDKIVLVGAGIKSVEDVKVSLKMGAKGILISSSIIKSQNPEEELEKLASAF